MIDLASASGNFYRATLC